MNARYIGYWLIAAAVLAFAFPNFHGVWFEGMNITAGDSWIIAAIFLVGGLILIALDKQKEKH
jgi:Flp pilus assembly protein protease CpaA